MKEIQTSTGVDWVTVTSNDEEHGHALYNLFLAYAKSPRNKANLVESWQDRHYVGQQTEGVVWGYSDINKGYLMRASGQAADVLWEDMYQASQRVTRLDLQSTVILPTPETGYVKTRHTHALDARADKKIPKIDLYDGSDGADTLYIGSRYSAFFGRLYDKAREANLGDWSLDRVFRYEVQITKHNGDFGTEVARQLHEMAEDGKSITAAIRRFINDWFSNRYVPTEIPVSNGTELRIPVYVPQTSSEKRLEWLHNQVRPTLQKLMAAGLSVEALEALSLDQRRLLEVLEIMPDVPPEVMAQPENLKTRGRWGVNRLKKYE